MRIVKRLREVAVLFVAVGLTGCAGPAGQQNMVTGPTPTPSLASSGASIPGGGGWAMLGRAYDATGVWRLAIADQRSGEVFDEVDTALTQHSDGTITFCGECEGELFTLTPRGAARGSAVPYELSYFGEGEPCNATATGTAVLDTRTGTIKAHGVRGTSDDCSSLLVSISLIRQS